MRTGSCWYSPRYCIQIFIDELRSSNHKAETETVGEDTDQGESLPIQNLQ